MSFLLKIVFSGLMALVPSSDGKELTVLLLNVDHGYHLSDGTKLVRHKPLLLARAGSCTGDCPTRDPNIARFVFADKTSDAAADALEQAVGGGGAWQLSGSDLSVQKGATNDPDLPPLTLVRNVRGVTDGISQVIPTTAGEREDISWVADMKQICPGCTLNPAVLSDHPPAGLIAARLHLRSGRVFTYSVVRMGTHVTPVHFKRLDGQGNSAPYTQAVASWVSAEIEISGDSVEILDESFIGGTGRSMRLTPSEGKVEVAVINLPPFVPPSSPVNAAPQVGKHFEMYYDLSPSAPAKQARLVPRALTQEDPSSLPEVDWQLIHPQDQLWCDLLNRIRLDAGRGAYDRVICPMVTF